MLFASFIEIILLIIGNTNIIIAFSKKKIIKAYFLFISNLLYIIFYIFIYLCYLFENYLY